MASKREPEQSELDGFVPLELTPEQRLLQRTVPFFPLPGYETVPNTANIKARVDTHNPSYKCPRPQSAAPKLQDKHPKQDYSHVVARVYTGRGQPLQQSQTEAKMESSNGMASSGRRISTGSDEGKPPMLEHRRFKRQRPASAGPSITGARSMKERMAFSGQNFSQVRAKVDSLHNIHYQPGGGNVTIGKYPKPVIQVTPKVNMRENINYIPGGGSVKYPTYETCHFKAEAKSKLDCSDPNPAHKLQHSIKELGMTEARKLNPRFNPDLTRSTLYRSKTFDSSKRVHQATAGHSNSSDNRAKGQLTKSDSLPSFVGVPLVVGEETNEHKPKSCVTVVPDKVVEQGNHSDTIPNGQIGNYKHDTDEVVSGEKQQDTMLDNGEGCATIPACSVTFHPKGSDECSPKTTKEMDSASVEASNSKAETTFVNLPLKKGAAESPDETRMESELEDTISGTVLVPQVVVYGDDGTVVETVDVAKEEHHEAVQTGAVGRTHTYHDGQQDNDDQNRITKL